MLLQIFHMANICMVELVKAIPSVRYLEILKEKKRQQKGLLLKYKYL